MRARVCAVTAQLPSAVLAPLSRTSALTNLHAQLLKKSIAACRVSMHAVHWCSVLSVREAAQRAFGTKKQLDFVCRVPTSFLRDRYCKCPMHWRAAVLSLQV